MALSSTYGARKGVRAHVWDACGGRCHYCGVDLHPFRTFEVEHVVPISAGGTDELDNLVGSCRACNAKKRATEDRAAAIAYRAREEETTQWCKTCGRVVPAFNRLAKCDRAGVRRG